MDSPHVVPALGPQCWFDRGASFQFACAILCRSLGCSASARQWFGHLCSACPRGGWLGHPPLGACRHWWLIRQILDSTPAAVLMSGSKRRHMPHNWLNCVYVSTKIRCPTGQSKTHGVVCRHCCWRGLWPGCPVREVKESGTKARGSLGTLLAVAHCAARRTNRVGSHLRLAPQQRRWKWLEVQESFEHGPVEPQRLHITIETVASSRAQWCRAFCPERSVRSCGHGRTWLTSFCRRPLRRRDGRENSEIRQYTASSLWVLWSDFPLYSFWRCLSFACGCDLAFEIYSR